MERLHVIIDETLDDIYGCVQGGHAVAQWMLDNQSNQKWRNDYLIYLKGNLEEIKEKLYYKDIEFSEFREPDLDNKLTAIAILNNGKIFSKLKLIGKE